MVLVVALTNIQYVDMNSSRNLIVLAISIIFGLMLPFWLGENQDVINTGKIIIYITQQ